MERKIRVAAASQPMRRRSRAAAYAVGSGLAVASIGALAALAGYFPAFQASKDDSSAGVATLSPDPSCRQCGTIERIQRLGPGGSESGLGGVTGGLAGAVAGRQLGAGEGGLVLAFLGAATGAQAGSRVAEGVGRTLEWRIYVRMEDGGLRHVDQKDAPALVVGDRVRLVRGSVVARS